MPRTLRALPAKAIQAHKSRRERLSSPLAAAGKNSLNAKSREAAGPKEGRTKVRQRRPVEVRARIVSAALHAFARDGFKGARMRSIADAAGVTIQLLVYHVSSKEKLWQMTMHELMKDFHEHRAATGERVLSLSATEKLRALIRDYVEFGARRPEVHRLMTIEGNHITPRLVWLIENFTRQAFDEICGVIVAAQKEGGVRRLDVASLRYAIVAMSSVPFSVAAEYEYLVGKSPFNQSEVERCINLICDLIFL